jgi:hypothetical protein
LAGRLIRLTLTLDAWKARRRQPSHRRSFGYVVSGKWRGNVGPGMGGIAQVSQAQLLQPFVTLAISALLLGEKVTGGTMLFALAVMTIVALGRKARVS